MNDFINDIISGRSRIFHKGAPTPKGVRQIIFLHIFGQKLHENQRIWTEKGSHPWIPPRNPPLTIEQLCHKPNGRTLLCFTIIL